MNMEEVISRQRIILRNDLCTKEEALQQLIQSFCHDEIVDDGLQFRKDIDLREKEFCTYVGHETAIPHAISTAAVKAGIAFLRSEEPFIYGEEQECVRLMFMLSIPQHSNEDHLRMLSMLATKLMHQDFREQLLNASDAEEIYQLLSSI